MCAYEPPDPPNEEDDLAELGAPTPGQMVTEGYNPCSYAVTTGPDGLPMEDLTNWQSHDNAPIPITPETLSCLAQDKCEEHPNGLKTCKYYKRQRVHNPEAPDEPMIQRFCTHRALRGLNGAAMSVGDGGVFNCELRRPRDRRATRVMDAIDARKITIGQERMRLDRQGIVKGYPIFPTPEQIAAGKYVLDEDEMVTVNYNRPKTADLMRSDEAPAERAQESTDGTPERT